MRSWLRSLFRGRPWWMNAMMVFSAYMAFFYVPWDFLFKPAGEDAEVWFGIAFTGAAAKLLEPLHWAVYAAGAYGFRKMRPWMHPWASLYVGQIGFSMLVWNWFAARGGGIFAGLVSGGIFAWLAVLLWRSRPLFRDPRPTLRERYGEWAVVTGASSGIGAEFARALAGDGVSCVLTARREAKLRELASELEKQHQVATRIAAVDLSEPDGADRLAEAVGDLEVGVLVNNAGAGYAGRFEKQDGERLRRTVQLNCTAPVVLTSRLLPGMLERGRGAVIVTGSVAGRQPLPFHGVYAATKAFDQLFGEALHVELGERGIDVLVIEPGSTQTEFQEVAGELPHEGEPPEDVVRVALDALGRQGSVVSGWWNWLRANLGSRLLPRGAVAHIAADVVARQTPEEMR